MSVERDALSRAETVTVAAIEDSVPLVAEARDIVAAFHTMLRKRAIASLDGWIEQARHSQISCNPPAGTALSRAAGV